uniref:CARD domain-containing protein n=1 Tax=Biomphalaria glabrata TaxID=6526 RepID=A0A2C9L0Y2_BIOGL
MRRCSQNKKTVDVHSGKRDRLKNKDEMLIQNNFVYLIEQIEPLDIIDYLFQQNVLTLDDMDLIKNASITRSKRAENLLFVLLKSGSSSALEVFMKSLENQYAYVLSHMKENHSNIEMTLSAVETAVGNRQEDSQV